MHRHKQAAHLHEQNEMFLMEKEDMRNKMNNVNASKFVVPPSLVEVKPEGDSGKLLEKMISQHKNGCKKNALLEARLKFLEKDIYHTMKQNKTHQCNEFVESKIQSITKCIVLYLSIYIYSVYCEVFL